MHPVGGDVQAYRSLVASLGPAPTVCLIADPALRAAAAPQWSLAERARHYDGVLRARFGGPDSHLRLGGWSFGARVAMEMAGLAEAGGQPVDALYLLIRHHRKPARWSPPTTRPTSKPCSPPNSATGPQRRPASTGGPMPNGWPTAAGPTCAAWPSIGCGRSPRPPPSSGWPSSPPRACPLPTIRRRQPGSGTPACRPPPCRGGCPPTTTAS
ncbi:thioesterase domain-containing protein [Streptomyces sp. M10(2022)]